MELFRRKQEFQDAVISTADYYKVNPAIVKKDYYITVVLNSDMCIVKKIIKLYYWRVIVKRLLFKKEVAYR